MPRGRKKAPVIDVEDCDGDDLEEASPKYPVHDVVEDCCSEKEQSSCEDSSEEETASKGSESNNRMSIRSESTSNQASHCSVRNSADSLLKPHVHMVTRGALSQRSKEFLGTEAVGDFVTDLATSLSSALDLLKSGCEASLDVRLVQPLWKWTLSRAMKEGGSDPEADLLTACCILDLYELHKLSGCGYPKCTKTEASAIIQMMTCCFKTITAEKIKLRGGGEVVDLSENGGSSDAVEEIELDHYDDVTTAAGMQRLQWRRRFHLLDVFNEGQLYFLHFETLIPEATLTDWLECSLGVLNKINMYNKAKLSEYLKRTCFVDLDRFARLLAGLVVETLQEAAQRSDLKDSLYDSVVDMLLNLLYQDTPLGDRLNKTDNASHYSSNFGYVGDICSKTLTHLLYGGILNEKLCTAFVATNRQAGAKRSKKTVQYDWSRDSVAICRTAELLSLVAPRLIERALSLILSDLSGTESNEAVISLAIAILFSENREAFTAFHSKLRLELLSLFQSKHINHRLCGIRAATDAVANRDTPEHAEMIDNLVKHVIAAACNDPDSKVRQQALLAILASDKMGDIIFIEGFTPQLTQRMGKRPNANDTVAIRCLAGIYRKYGRTFWEGPVMTFLFEATEDSQSEMSVAVMPADELIIQIPCIILDYLGSCFEVGDGPGILACEAALSDCLFEDSLCDTAKSPESQTHGLIIGLFGILFGIHRAEEHSNISHRQMDNPGDRRATASRLEVLLRYFQVRFLTGSFLTQLADEVESISDLEALHDAVYDSSENQETAEALECRSAKKNLPNPQKTRQFGVFSHSSYLSGKFYTKGNASLLYSAGSQKKNPPSALTNLIQSPVCQILQLLSPSISSDMRGVFETIDKTVQLCEQNSTTKGKFNEEKTTDFSKEDTNFSYNILNALKLMIPSATKVGVRISKQCIKLLQDLKKEEWDQNWFASHVKTLRSNPTEAFPLFLRIVPSVLCEGSAFYEFIFTLNHAVSRTEVESVKGELNAYDIKTVCESMIDHVIAPLTLFGLQISRPKPTPGPAFGLSADICVANMASLCDAIEDQIESSKTMEDCSGKSIEKVGTALQKIAALQKAIFPLLSMSPDLSNFLIDKICSTLKIAAASSSNSRVVSCAVSGLLELRQVRPLALKSWMMEGMELLANTQDRNSDDVKRVLDLFSSALRMYGRDFFSLLCVIEEDTNEDEIAILDAMSKIVKACEKVLYLVSREAASIPGERNVVIDCLCLISQIASCCKISSSRDRSPEPPVVHDGKNRRLSSLPISPAQCEIYGPTGSPEDHDPASGKSGASTLRVNNTETSLTEDVDELLFIECQRLLLLGLQHADNFFLPQKTPGALFIAPSYVLASPPDPSRFLHDEAKEKFLRQTMRAQQAARCWFELVESSQTISLYDASSNGRIIQLLASHDPKPRTGGLALEPHVSVYCAHALINVWKTGVFHNSFNALLQMSKVPFQSSIGPAEKEEIFKLLLSLFLPSSKTNSPSEEAVANSSSIELLLQNNIYFAFLLPATIATWIGFPPVQFKALKAMQYLIFEILRHAKKQDTGPASGVTISGELDKRPPSDLHSIFGRQYKCTATYFSLIFESTLRILEGVEVIFGNNGEQVFRIVMPFVDALLRIFNSKQHVIVPYLIKQCESIALSLNRKANAQQETLRSICKYLLQTQSVPPKALRIQSGGHIRPIENDGEPNQTRKVQQGYQRTVSQGSSEENCVSARARVLGPQTRRRFSGDNRHVEADSEMRDESGSGTESRSYAMTEQETHGVIAKGSLALPGVTKNDAFFSSSRRMPYRAANIPKRDKQDQLDDEADDMELRASDNEEIVLMSYN